MIVLGIETSCDETAVAVVGDRPRPTIRANLIRSQLAEHTPYGGVVPEIAARAHLDHLDRLIGGALAAADTTIGQIDGVAAAAGPGLIGGLIVGSTTAKGLAWAAGKPFIAVNHLEAHALAARLAHEVPFPYLLLLVSGGHSQLLVCAGVGQYRQLGISRDDAAGEAFDKTAKLLGLGYPGGPALSRLAEAGTPGRYRLPRPMLASGDLEFSFSGLKTAVLTLVKGTVANEQFYADVARAFQEAIVEVLVAKCAAALEQTGLRRLVVAGGVGANRQLRTALEAAARRRGFDVFYPELELCTDNGAMIAFAAALRVAQSPPLARGAQAFTVRPRWELAVLNQP